MEIVTVLSVEDHAAEVELPDTSVEVWQLASLPPEVQPGDQVGITVTAGDMEMVILGRLGGLQA